MRCLSCDRRLNDRESVRKYSNSGTFVDLCDRCFSTIADEVPDVEGDYPEDLPFEDDIEGDQTDFFFGYTSEGNDDGE